MASRALFSGYAGTSAHQARMDVLANNLANTNTVGFKESRTTFRDAFYETMRGGTSSSGGGGGQNPIQLGSGVSVGAVETIHSQGAIEATGYATDAAINGSGFFILSDGISTYYTRDGGFFVDANNLLVSSSTGMKVQGYIAANGVVDTQAGVSDIRLDVGSAVPAEATANVLYSGNLDANSATGDSRVTTVMVYDSLGLEHTITVTFTKTATANQWNWEAEDELGNTAGPTALTFDAQGNLPAGTTGTLSMVLANGAATPQAVSLSLSAITQMGGETTADAGSQDGRAAAVVQSVSVERNGIVKGNLSDGRSLQLAQIALAKFANPSGLDRAGQNLYGGSDASGLPVVGRPNTGGRGDVQGRALEQSNVDLTKAFVDVIITQRGFQASARVLSAANELLQEVIQLAGQ